MLGQGVALRDVGLGGLAGCLGGRCLGCCSAACIQLLLTETLCLPQPSQAINFVRSQEGWARTPWPFLTFGLRAWFHDPFSPQVKAFPSGERSVLSRGRLSLSLRCLPFLVLSPIEGHPACISEEPSSLIGFHRMEW